MIMINFGTNLVNFGTVGAYSGLSEKFGVPGTVRASMGHRKDMITLTSRFLPEGQLLNTAENKELCATVTGFRRALAEGRILEGTVQLCDAEHNLVVSLGDYTGVIPRAEAALGIAEGSTREIAILSRVGKPVAVMVISVEENGGTLTLRLSRRAAQRKALDDLMARLRPGDVLPAVVTHLEPFGTFVDLACGVSSMISIENSSISRIPHPKERFFVGQAIYVAVLDLERTPERIYLTHRELLGTWAENATQFKSGMTVVGYVRGIKEYGAFVELTPNLSGLAELRPDLQEGDRVAVYIKAILPERMKIKLLTLERLPPVNTLPYLSYFITAGRIGKWKYAPDGCPRVSAETVFSG